MSDRGKMDKAIEELLNTDTDANETSEDCIQRLEDRVERLEEALLRIVQWSEAYPLPAFPEPDDLYFKVAREALGLAGLSLDRLSASAMRHVIKGVGQVAREALKPCT